MGKLLQERLGTAEFQGKEAAIAGVPESKCPYSGKLEHHGGVTFSPAFRKAWLKGHRAQIAEILRAKRETKQMRRRTAKSGAAHV